jgi:hypothetical protein
MPDGKLPGPLSQEGVDSGVQDGTSALAPSPTPGSVGTGASFSTAPASAAATPATDPQIEALNLASTAKKAAYELKKKHPAISFTSGRRNKDDQARAMAGNVTKNRKWIEQTYSKSTAREKCQKWLDDNPDKITKDDIKTGLASVLEDLTDAELARLSKHLSGDAFDVKPVDADADKIKKTIRSLTGLTRFLDSEGGLTRWHAQF